MPYAKQGAFYEAIREYLTSLRPRDARTERGVVRKKTVYEYQGILYEAGQLLGLPDPRHVTLAQMKALESQISGGSERTFAKKLSVIRAFLRYSGNQDALKWRVARHPTPYRGGVFLSERQVAKLHQEAARLGPLAELVISLAVDNGLRCVDIHNLTMENALEFLDFGESEILGKGRDGGKMALQTFSKYTIGPLKRYLAEREKMFERNHAPPSEFLVWKETTYFRPARMRRSDKDDMRDIAIILSERMKLRFGMHDLRRTLGHRLHRRGWPIETIAKILRHEDCGQTFRAYIGVDSCEMRAALDSLTPEMSSQSETGA